MLSIVVGQDFSLEKWKSRHLAALTEIVATSLDHIARWMPSAAGELADHRPSSPESRKSGHQTGVDGYAIVENDEAVAGHHPCANTPSG
jgi:hypothetical protein